jgi:hypothetical protein
MGNLYSPDQIVEAGIDMMLGGRAPASRDDQMLLMNFVATNVASGLEGAVCRLMASLYPDKFGMLSETDVDAIATYQHELK